MLEKKCGESGSSSSEQLDSGDELIDKNKYDELLRDYRNLEKANDKLENELSRSKKRVEKLEDTNEKLSNDLRCQSKKMAMIENLNFQYQAKLLADKADTKVPSTQVQSQNPLPTTPLLSSTPSAKKVLFPEEKNQDNVVSSPSKSIWHVSNPKALAPICQSELSSPNKIIQLEKPAQAEPEEPAQAEPEEPAQAEPNESAEANEESEPPSKKPRLLLNVTPKKMRKVLLNVKGDVQGDSQFVKNLAHVVFGVPLLIASSVTGKTYNQNKFAKTYPALPTEGVDYIKECFIERMKNETPVPTKKEMELREGKVKTYISGKIKDLRRALKNCKKVSKETLEAVKEETSEAVKEETSEAVNKETLEAVQEES
nr:PREDICTED: uncharacterized protein LOC109035734 isoform X2 [Bemisia tabaci]